MWTDFGLVVHMVCERSLIYYTSVACSQSGMLCLSKFVYGSTYCRLET